MRENRTSGSAWGVWRELYSYHYKFITMKIYRRSKKLGYFYGALFILMIIPVVQVVYVSISIPALRLVALIICIVILPLTYVGLRYIVRNRKFIIQVDDKAIGLHEGKFTRIRLEDIVSAKEETRSIKNINYVILKIKNERKNKLNEDS